MRRMTVVSALCAAVVLCGCDEVKLPKAAFDRGGTTFDLKALSAKRFPIKEGGQTAFAARRTVADPKDPVILEVDMAAKRKEFYAATGTWPRGVAFRYRFKQTKADSSDPKCWLSIHGMKWNEKGELVENQPVWHTKIRETGNAWADYCYYDIGIRSSSDVARFSLDLGNDGLGSFEIKDFNFVAMPPSEKRTLPLWRADPEKSYIFMRQVGTDNYDGEYRLGRGQVQLVVLDWMTLDKKRAESTPWQYYSVRVELPEGVELVAGNDVAPRTKPERGKAADGRAFYEWHPNSEQCPKFQRWGGWARPTFFITTTLPVGACPGKISVVGKCNGKVESPVLEFPVVVDEPVVARAVPKRYFNGLVCGREYRLDKESAYRVAETLIEIGVRGTSCHTEPFASCMKELVEKKGETYHKWGSSYFLQNGFMIGTHPNTDAKRPENERFVADDPKYKPDLMARATCPMAIYNEGRYYREYVKPMYRKFWLEDIKSIDYSAVLCNWEPNSFFNHGCMCENCKREFATWAKIPLADVAAGWPQNVRIGGKYREPAARFRAWQHGKLMKKLQQLILETLGFGADGFCPMLAWTAATGQLLEAPGAEEIASEEYMGAMKWFNPWGPYVWWDASVPYFHEKRYCVAEWEAARVIREKTDRTYTNHVNLVSFPHGKQGNTWEEQPEWLEMCLDSYFFNRWEGSLAYYFPLGYDTRWLRAFARATERAAYYEDYVWDGERADDKVEITPVAEYAAPCHMVTAYLPQSKNVSPLQCAAFDLKGSRIVAVVNFWEDAEAFFTLKCRGLADGKYTVVSDRQTVWTRAGGVASWSAAELEKGVFVAVGKARTKVFEIRPVAKDGNLEAKDMMDAADVRRLYEELRPSLRREADRDHEEEAGRTILNPDGTPII